MTSRDDSIHWKELVVTCGIVIGVLMVLFWMLRFLWRVVATLVPHLAAGVVVGAFQLIMVGTVALIAVGIPIILFLWLFRWAIGRFAELEAADAEILRELRKQSPSFLLATALVADCVLAIADKPFENPAVIVCVTVVLILLFGIANHLFARFEGGFAKAVGWFLWVTGLVIVPIAVMLSKQWTFAQLATEIRKLPAAFLIVFAASFLLAVVCPFALRPRS